MFARMSTYGLEFIYMRGHLYLIGGGEIATGETQKIDHAIKMHAQEESTLVFFGTAAGDHAGYIHTIESVFGDTFTVIAATHEKGKEFAVNAIEKATVIYLGGGQTDLLLNLFAEWELVEILRAAWERGVHIAGLSAGAQALAAWYIHEEGDTLELRQGWGLADVCVLVHAREEIMSTAKDIWEKSEHSQGAPFIAIKEGQAFEV
jgi:peptidase E